MWDSSTISISISGPSCSDFHKSWNPFDRHRSKKWGGTFVAKYLPCIVDRSPSNERQEGQAQSVPRLVPRLCCWAAKSLERSHLRFRIALPNKTLDITSSLRSLLAESRGHQRPREAIAKLRFAPASRNLFSAVAINSQNLECYRTLTSDCQRSGISQSYLPIIFFKLVGMGGSPSFRVLLVPRIWRGLFWVTHDGLSERGTTRSLSEIDRILHILWKPNSIIALLFIKIIFPFLKEFRHFALCFFAHQK